MYLTIQVLKKSAKNITQGNQIFPNSGLGGVREGGIIMITDSMMFFMASLNSNMLVTASTHLGDRSLLCSFLYENDQEFIIIVFRQSVFWWSVSMLISWPLLTIKKALQNKTISLKTKLIFWDKLLEKGSLWWMPYGLITYHLQKLDRRELLLHAEFLENRKYPSKTYNSSINYLGMLIFIHW